MKIGAIIQARISSTRLPGKILRELPYNSGITCLEQVIRRLKKSKRLNDIIIATTKEKEDVEVFNFNVLEKSLEEELKEAIKILDLQDLNKARDFLKENLSR